MEYCPGSSLLCGKLYCPCASVTTVIVIVEPALLALTSTPSIIPSSCELTRPPSAGEEDVCEFAILNGTQNTATSSRIDTKMRRLIMRSPFLLAAPYRACIRSAHRFPKLEQKPSLNIIVADETLAHFTKTFHSLR